MPRAVSLRSVQARLLKVSRMPLFPPMYPSLRAQDELPSLHAGEATSTTTLNESAIRSCSFCRKWVKLHVVGFCLLMWSKTWPWGCPCAALSLRWGEWIPLKPSACGAESRSPGQRSWGLADKSTHLPFPGGVKEFHT